MAWDCFVDEKKRPSPISLETAAAIEILKIVI